MNIIASMLWITGHLEVHVVIDKPWVEDDVTRYWTGDGWAPDAHQAHQFDTAAGARDAASDLAQKGAPPAGEPLFLASVLRVAERRGRSPEDFAARLVQRYTGDVANADCGDERAHFAWKRDEAQKVVAFLAKAA